MRSLSDHGFDHRHGCRSPSAGLGRHGCGHVADHPLLAVWPAATRARTRASSFYSAEQPGRDIGDHLELGIVSMDA